MLAAKVAVLNTACRLEAQHTEGWTCYAAHLNGASQACRGEVRRRCQLCNRRTCLQHSYACRGCESEREIEYESLWDEVNKWWDERETAASKARGEVEVPRVCHGCVEDSPWHNPVILGTNSGLHKLIRRKLWLSALTNL